MPIIHFINNKTQTAGGMRNVLNYVSRKEKTVSEDKRYVTGVNCSPETALDEMTATKNLYHKENMEYEFETRRIAADVRQGIVGSGGHSADSVGARCQLESTDKIEQADVAGAAGNTQQTFGSGDESRDRTGAENSSFRAERYNSDLSGAAGSNVGNCDVSSRAVEESNSEPVITGWEAERAVWLEAERARRVQAQAQIESSQVDSNLAVNLDSIVGGVTAVAALIEDEPAEDTEYAREHVDSKAHAEERERKEAHGIHMG